MRKGGIIETEKSEGYVRGSWDMRYLATLIRLNKEKGDSQSQDFVDIINTKKGWTLFKEDMIAEIERLNSL